MARAARSTGPNRASRPGGGRPRKRTIKTIRTAAQNRKAIAKSTSTTRPASKGGSKSGPKLKVSVSRKSGANSGSNVRTRKATGVRKATTRKRTTKR